MANTRGGDDFSELEALIHSAGNVFEPSGDLRPRVLEAARQRCKCMSFESLLHQAAILLLVGSVLTAVVSGPTRYSSEREAATLGLGLNDSLTESTLSSRDPGWGMVESFTELRRRQANLFRFDL